MMSACCSKHVEAWNEHIEKECIKLVIIPNYFEMHGQKKYKIMHDFNYNLPVKGVSNCRPLGNKKSFHLWGF